MMTRAVRAFSHPACRQASGIVPAPGKRPPSLASSLSPVFQNGTDRTSLIAGCLFLDSVDEPSPFPDGSPPAEGTLLALLTRRQCPGAGPEAQAQPPPGGHAAWSLGRSLVLHTLALGPNRVCDS